MARMKSRRASHWVGDRGRWRFGLAQQHPGSVESETGAELGGRPSWQFSLS